MCVILPIIIALWVWLYAFTPGPVSSSKDIQVLIPADTGFKGIERILSDQKVIVNDVRFAILARLMGVANHLKAGEYSFPAGIVPYRVLAVLEAGKVIQRAVTIPEGSNIYQIAEILAAQEWVDRDYFLSLVADPEFSRSLGIAADTLEGYLFPETYHLEHGGQSTQEIIKMMINQTRAVVKELGPVEDHATSMTLHEIITLASIVEKETGLPSERPLIAAVFLNRLRQGMRLQADPTVIYGASEFNGNLTRNHLKERTPYNTYVIKGLPPGPICNPGRASLEAVLHPAAESYLYFVSKKDGSHYFSRTLAEHNQAVNRFQKNQ